jgi:uncharacterized protein YecT (DUF1311 family)
MKILALMLIIYSLPALAQDSEQYRSCQKKAQTQSEMNICASQEAARVDASLKDAFHGLLSKVSGQEAAVAKITAVENAWTSYRDAYIEAMYPAKDKQSEYGSLYPMNANLLRAKLTQRQIIALKELNEHYNNGGQ